MNDDHVAVILTRNVRDTRLDTDFLLIIGTEDAPGRLEASVAVSVSAFNNPEVEKAFDRAEREYDPTTHDDGTIVARIHILMEPPSGHWKPTNNHRISAISRGPTPVFLAAEPRRRERTHVQHLRR